MHLTLSHSHARLEVSATLRNGFFQEYVRIVLAGTSPQFSNANANIVGTSAALAFPLIFMAIYINNFLKESPHQDGQNGDFDDDMQESKVLSWTSQVSEDVSPASKQNYWRSFTKKAFGRETSSLKVESQLERGEKIVDKGASG